MVSLNIFSALTVGLISLTGTSAVTLQALDKRAYQNTTSCIATTQTKTSYSPYTVYGTPYSGKVSNQYTTPELASELEGSAPVFSIYVAQDFYNISDFNLISTEVTRGLTLSQGDIKIYSGDVGNFVQVSRSIFNIGSETNNSISVSLNGRTNDPLLRIDIPGIITESEEAYSVSFLLVLDSLTTTLAKRDQLTFELFNTFANPLYVSSTTSGASSSSSSSLVAPSSQISGISSTTSSILSSSTESSESSSVSSTGPDSTESISSPSGSFTSTDSTESIASSSGSFTSIDSTESIAAPSGSFTSTDSTESIASPSVSSTATDSTGSVASSTYTSASSDAAADSLISSNDEDGSSITAKSTITETITSCSDNACYTTTQKAIISDTTLTIDGTVTVVETTCPVSENQTISTFTESTTITEVVTSCSDNECSSFTWTAVPSAYTTTILDVVYTLTTYCPVGSNPVPSPAVNVGGGASVDVAAVSETITIGETKTVISTICTLSSGVAVETYYTTTTAANGQVQGTAVVHTFSDFIANPSYSALENTITAVAPSTSTTTIPTESSETSLSIEVYSENGAKGMNGQNSFTSGAIAAIIGLVMLL